MALYTGKGDKGTTKLFDSEKGVRVSKTSDIFEALGTLDELNTILGWCKVLCDDSLVINDVQVKKMLHNVQDHIFTAQAEIAGAEKTIPEKNVKEIEKVIADIESRLPEIKTFFVPGGTELSARFDIARAVSRRAERRVLQIHESGGREIGEYTRVYLNRLSSLLYAFVRFVNHKNEIEESPPDYQG
ncbi:ATP:cob(I)alamin adenosyltransferase [Candidatus Kaiserbacteria bacterium CG10_big_fil_rev_8_21_14_0_10_43_70]|uniref:Corrinoid adenosyltransferase n=1 Tax=Candidatus Kaiserbacteria bacterium CG10_big_fil_rev_8_21_14_0_10_43_70 TaxID=1974605 RepID=A0A2H0UJ26_9BACT|nr:MAG: ATP:cob(I)alamin adenosyltransferase [Candidatus Kaiserbacteria bacterium CG10_big_fil_rev_8_21_14_0_10_43_70]